MALAKFKREYERGKSIRNIMIAIYADESDRAHRSHLNRSLESFQKRLLENKEKDETIYISFVYGDATSDAKDFIELKEGNVKYLQNSRKSPLLHQVWFMAMILLEKKMQQDKKENADSQNEFYLFTDKVFERVEANHILTSSRFHDMQVKLALVKSEGAGRGKLEKYIGEHGEVYMDTDFQ